MGTIIRTMISADWHIGSTEPERFHQELIHMVKRVLTIDKGLDLFVVSGDIFDMKEYASSDVIKTCLKIIKELLDLTEPYQTQFRFIEGTRTHDAMQLETLEIIFNFILCSDRVKFIHSVESENLLGLHLLYVPEEYMVDSNLYYKTYFSKHYDMIFGHGMIDKIWYAKNDAIRVEKQTSAPVFPIKDLVKISNVTYFGHVHYHVEYEKGKFKYVGPFSRWEFDKEHPCGCYYNQYDASTSLYEDTFIENDEAPVLVTLPFSIKKDYTLDQLSNWISSTIESTKEEQVDRIRLIIVLDTTLDSFPMMRDFIMTTYGNLKDIKLILKFVGTNEDESKNQEETFEQVVEEKPYLYDKSMEDHARIASFIRKKSNINIPLENILEVISYKTSKIGDTEE